MQSTHNVTFRQTPEICLKMLTAVAFWEIFCNYTILTMLSVSTTTTALCAYTVLNVSTTANNYCGYFFKNFLCIEVYAVQQHVNVSTTTTALCSSRHVCNFFCTIPLPQFAPCIFGIFPRQTPQMQIVYKCGLVQGACIGNF